MLHSLTLKNIAWMHLFVGGGGGGGGKGGGGGGLVFCVFYFSPNFCFILTTVLARFLY